MDRDKPVEPNSEEHKELKEQIHSMESDNMARFAKYLLQNRIDLWKTFHQQAS